MNNDQFWSLIRQSPWLLKVITDLPRDLEELVDDPHRLNDPVYIYELVGTDFDPVTIESLAFIHFAPQEAIDLLSRPSRQILKPDQPGRFLRQSSIDYHLWWHADDEPHPLTHEEVLRATELEPHPPSLGDAWRALQAKEGERQPARVVHLDVIVRRIEFVEERLPDLDDDSLASLVECLSSDSTGGERGFEIYVFSHRLNIPTGS